MTGTTKHLVAIVLAASAGPVLAGTAETVSSPMAGGGTEARALVARMRKAFDDLTDYQCRFNLQVVNGAKRTDRKGSLYFKRPRQLLVKMGPLGILWRRDGTIRGWFVTRLLSHAHHPDDAILHDARGRRLDRYILGDVIEELRQILDEGASATVRTNSTTPGTLYLDIAPAEELPFSRGTYWVDEQTLLPVRWTTFEGSAKVEDVACLDLRVNVGLAEKLFQ